MFYHSAAPAPVSGPVTAKKSPDIDILHALWYDIISNIINNGSDRDADGYRDSAGLRNEADRRGSRLARYK